MLRPLQVEIRDKQTTTYCSRNYFSCINNCGTLNSRKATRIGSNSYSIGFCEQETVTKSTLKGNFPFEIR